MGGGELEEAGGSRSFRNRVIDTVCLLKNGFPLPIPSPCST